MGSARLCFELAQASQVDVRIFNITGQWVATLASGPLSAGEHRLNWDGRDGDGQDLPAGVYIARLRAARDTAIRKLVIAR
jgi:flagellar hook assembly protein FlgD